MPMNSGKESVYRKRTKDWKPQQPIRGEKAALVESSVGPRYWLRRLFPGDYPELGCMFSMTDFYSI